MFGILGPLEVGSDWGRIEIRGARRRSLLALLLVERGRVVSADRITERIWGGEPPSQARMALQAGVYQLRRALGPLGAHLVTRPSGYGMDVPVDLVDAARFERCVEGLRSDSPSPERTAELLGVALGWWRGPALADVPDAPWVRAEAARLEALRLEAVERRFEARLTSGEHGALVAELQVAVGEQPLRERLWGFLMLALYRDGRQADALAAFRRVRGLLVGELGIEPSAELSALHVAILEHDPALRWLPAGRHVPPRPPASSGALVLPAVVEVAQGPTRPSADELIGREVEVGLLTELLESARTGRTAVLAVQGEPGVGKTVLARAAEGLAAGDMTVLRAQGMEWESGLPMAMLSQLLRPISALEDDLSAGGQREAVRAVFGRGSAAALDPLALGAAVLGMLAAAAERRPVLITVDDVQWVDACSGRALAFALHRLQADRVAALLLGRHRVAALLLGRPDTLAGVPSDGTVGLPGAWPTHRLPGLAEAAVAALAARLSGLAPAPGVVRALASGTGGNPLALREALTALTGEQLAGRAPLPDPLPVGEGLVASFGARLLALPAPTRLALGVLAAAGSAAGSALGPALAVLGSGPAALLPAEASGAVRLRDREWIFDHPLIRTAALGTLPGWELRRVHAALAEVFLGLDVERHAWHLALAAPTATESVAATLEEAAEPARRRGGEAAVAEMLARATELSPPGPDRSRRGLMAASSLFLAGSIDRSLRLLDELTTDPVQAVRVEALLTRGELTFYSADTDGAADLLDALAAELGDSDPQQACRAFALRLGRMMQSGPSAAEVTAVIAGFDPRLLDRLPAEAGLGVRALIAVAVVLYGLEATFPGILTEELLAHAGALPVRHPLFQPLVQIMGWLGRRDEAAAICEGWVRRARSENALTVLANPLAVLGDLLWWAGAWSQSSASLDESLTLIRQTGQGQLGGFPLALLARVRGCLGRDEECRALAARALALERQQRAVGFYARHAIGLAALGEGDTGAAVAGLDGAHRLATDMGVRCVTVVPYAADRVEALAAAGAGARAEGALEEFEAMSSGSSWGRAAALRCRGLLAAPTEFDEAFTAALSAPEQPPFDRARVALAYGERLARARRGADARAQLSDALTRFGRLGAAPWTRRAGRALYAAGGHPPSQEEPTLAGSLTGDQLQVCLAVAAGATTREAADALFISPRTAAQHLRAAQDRLGTADQRALVDAVLARLSTAAES